MLSTNLRSKFFFLKTATVGLVLLCVLLFFRTVSHRLDMLSGSLLKTVNTSVKDGTRCSQKCRAWNTGQKSEGAVYDRRDAKRTKLDRLGVLFSMTSAGWSPRNCDKGRKLRSVSVKTGVGNLTFYVHGSRFQDRSVTAQAISGTFFEKKEISQFIRISSCLPLIDIGANVGLVALQAAMQGREVVAFEPIPENALRLCRSALDFGHASLVHVIQNAVSSLEGNVTMAMDEPAKMTHYEVQTSGRWGHRPVVVSAVLLDSLLDILPFKTAALKIDVESHEGHVLASAERLFKEVDIPMVWMEWVHVKGKTEYGGRFIIQFMERQGMQPHHLMTNKLLKKSDFMQWPFSVLWRKKKTA